MSSTKLQPNVKVWIWVKNKLSRGWVGGTASPVGFRHFPRNSNEVLEIPYPLRILIPFENSRSLWKSQVVSEFWGASHFYRSLDFPYILEFPYRHRHNSVPACKWGYLFFLMTHKYLEIIQVLYQHIWGSERKFWCHLCKGGVWRGLS